MKTAQLLATQYISCSGSIEVAYEWVGDPWLPIRIGPQLLHEGVLDRLSPIKIVYTTEYFFGIPTLYAVRTDEYPLMWLWYWWKIRFDKSLEFLIMGLVLGLEVWGLAKVAEAAKPSLGDLKLPAWLKR